MTHKSKTVDGKEVTYSTSWIKNLENEFHFSTYYEQAKHVYAHISREESLIEAGIGSGLLCDLLSRRGWNIKTVDIDSDKNPDFCSDVLSFDFNQGQFDALLAFEIFEHLPWDTFCKLLEKIQGTSISKILFSVPRCEYELLNFFLRCSSSLRVTVCVSVYSLFRHCSYLFLFAFFYIFRFAFAFESVPYCYNN